MGLWIGRVLGVELVGDGLHRARVDAPLPVDLARIDGLIGVGRAGLDGGVGEPVVGTVGLGVLGRRLARDLGDVVVEAVVPDGVVILQELALGTQGAVQVRGHGSGAERGLVPLVLELDHNDVVDLPRRKGRPHHRAGVRLRCRGQRRPEKQQPRPPGLPPRRHAGHGEWGDAP